MSRKFALYFRLCLGRRPSEELYDMESDPHQLNNLAGDAGHSEIKAKLVNQMEQFLREKEAPRMAGESPWDTYPFSDKRIFANPNWAKEGFPLKLK